MQRAEPVGTVLAGVVGACDGSLPLGVIVDAVAAILDEEQPTVVATFGPDGIFGHPDHIAIGAATDAAFLRSARPDGTAFRRLLHGAVPESVFRRWNAQRSCLGLSVFDPTATYHMRGVPDEEIGVAAGLPECDPPGRRGAPAAPQPAPRDVRRPR
jgi:N-acetyl-1-D-myo-inositol-2-amino-2-deoxy-alpha-D-glucopyranoside deacetylase